MNIDSNEILVKQILNICFPVGKIEIFYDNLDHSNYMGFAWQRCLSERSPIGYNSSASDSFKTIGSQFGEKRHTLTINEMPSHSHPSAHVNTTVKGSDNVSSQNWPSLLTRGINDTSGWNQDTAYAGGSQSHNNIHPVEVVAFWRRIS